MTKARRRISLEAAMVHYNKGEYTVLFEVMRRAGTDTADLETRYNLVKTRQNDVKHRDKQGVVVSTADRLSLNNEEANLTRAIQAAVIVTFDK